MNETKTEPRPGPEPGLRCGGRVAGRSSGPCVAVTERRQRFVLHGSHLAPIADSERLQQVPIARRDGHVPPLRVDPAARLGDDRIRLELSLGRVGLTCRAGSRAGAFRSTSRLTLGCVRLQPDSSRTATVTGSAGSARPTGGRRNQRTIAMITRTKLVIGTLTAGLALAACGSVAGTSGQGNHGKPVAQHQAQRGGSRVDEVTRCAWRHPAGPVAGQWPNGLLIRVGRSPGCRQGLPEGRCPVRRLAMAGPTHQRSGLRRDRH